MKHTIVAIMLLAGAIGTMRYATAQTTYFSNQYGQPMGSATQSGNTTYFSNQYGQPMGSATQSGNTTYFSNQYGQPLGSASNPYNSNSFSTPTPSNPWGNSQGWQWGR